MLSILSTVSPSHDAVAAVSPSQSQQRARKVGGVVGIPVTLSHKVLITGRRDKLPVPFFLVGLELVNIRLNVGRNLYHQWFLETVHLRACVCMIVCVCVWRASISGHRVLLRFLFFLDFEREDELSH